MQKEMNQGQGSGTRSLVLDRVVLNEVRAWRPGWQACTQVSLAFIPWGQMQGHHNGVEDT